MGAPIFAGMAGFAENFTRAYSGEKRRQTDEEDRKAEREWRKEQQARQRQEWNDADQLKTELKDAGAVRTEQQGTATQGQFGGRNDANQFCRNQGLREAVYSGQDRNGNLEDVLCRR